MPVLGWVTIQGKAGARGGGGGGVMVVVARSAVTIISCRVSWSPLSSTQIVWESHPGCLCTQIVCSMGISPWVSFRIALIIAASCAGWLILVRGLSQIVFPTVSVIMTLSPEPPSLPPPPPLASRLNCNNELI